jgi:hypothetical protein
MTWHPDIPLEYRNQIVTGDARMLAERIPGASVGLVFVDPPYRVGFVYGSGISDEEMPVYRPELLVQHARRIAPLVLITPGMTHFWEYPPSDWICGWFKPGSTRRSAVLNGFNTWEPILVYGKPKKRVYQDSSYLPTVSNLNGPDANFHGCPKPLALMRWIVEQFTEPGDIVVDFMVGSGTTAIAAKELGRNYIAFEIDPITADLARERVRNTQPPLFVPEPEQLEMVL